ncbi:hypothetical protein [Chengkuizengella marina]|uniref:Uncharacterized protein n=1 Tax=Chengkuizengella marina TaxID=2507566 RepID=A0A6N9PZ56_9BACL|nr:hypothetical protein [Chengkuizengella marina]NBI28811.1 hypothetical protein [Chengkuizengella marina]
MKAKKIAASIGLSTLLIGGLLYGTLSNSSSKAHSLSATELIESQQKVSEDIIATVEITSNTPDLMEVKTTQNNNVYISQFKLIEDQIYTLIKTNVWSNGEEDKRSSIVELTTEFDIQEYAALLQDTYDAIYDIEHSVRVLGDQYFETEKYEDDLKKNDETNVALINYKEEYMISKVSEDLLVTVEVTNNTPDLMEMKRIQNDHVITTQFKLIEDHIYTLTETNVWGNGEEESGSVKAELSPDFNVEEYAALLQGTYSAIYDIEHSIRVLGDKYFETEKYEHDLKNNDETNQAL